MTAAAAAADDGGGGGGGGGDDCDNDDDDDDKDEDEDEDKDEDEDDDQDDQDDDNQDDEGDDDDDDDGNGNDDDDDEPHNRRSLARPRKWATRLRTSGRPSFIRRLLSGTDDITVILDRVLALQPIYRMSIISEALLSGACFFFFGLSTMFPESTFFPHDVCDSRAREMYARDSVSHLFPRINEPRASSSRVVSTYSWGGGAGGPRKWASPNSTFDCMRGKTGHLKEESKKEKEKRKKKKKERRKKKKGEKNKEKEDNGSSEYREQDCLSKPILWGQFRGEKSSV